MAASSATAAVSGVLLPHALLYHSSAPPRQLLAVPSYFRRLSLSASPRRTTHLVARADAGEPEPAADPEPEAEPVAASADAEEEESEGAVAVAAEEEDEPPVRSLGF